MRAGARNYVAEWAFSRAEERRAFERFVDFVMARWAQYPGLHIYHYAPYEPSALKRLMGRYATREDEIDRMLRASLFVDLYTIARQSIRASVERYSIKNLEPFYDFNRGVPLVEVRSALAKLQARLELNDAAAITDESKDIVLRYNRDDCLSAQRLRDWLEKIRGEMIANGAAISRPAADDPEPSPELDERQRQVAALVERLTADVPADAVERSTEQQARWILAHSLDWHRRELKSVLVGVLSSGRADARGSAGRAQWHRRARCFAPASVGRRGRRFIAISFPPQELELSEGDTLHLSQSRSSGTVAAISAESGTIDIKKRGDTAALHPQAAFAHDLVRTGVMADALLRLGRSCRRQWRRRARVHIRRREISCSRSRRAWRTSRCS